jgi:hypothetical protein
LDQFSEYKRFLATLVRGIVAMRILNGLMADYDLDLLVILPTVVDRFEEMVRLRLVLRDMPMAIDVIVYSRADVEERRHLRGTMLYHTLREGRTLHDAA